VTFQARHPDVTCDLKAVRLAAKPVVRPSLPTRNARILFAVLTLGMTLLVGLGVIVNVAHWTAWSVLAVALVLPSLLWISGGAATALTGMLCPPRAEAGPPAVWCPAGRTAILMLLCRENPQPVAAALTELLRQTGKAGLGPSTRVIVLSDTFGAEAIAAEESALAPLIAAGLVDYRRRADNTGRKPGNIAEWFDRAGQRFAYMLVMDADSRMSGARIRRMIWRMEQQPDLGLLQAGMALLPARSRFGQFQRTASRLLGPHFGAGLAAWTGATGNYWGHNALIRTAAFTDAAHLPALSGTAPFGGDILSHDIIEAAVIRRGGWAVVFDPAAAGSAEDGPQDLASYHRRNRRWCQGNLQHIRLIAAPGLHPISRLHIASGIFSFLAAPVWLILVLMMGTGLVVLEGAVPLLLIVAVLLVPKIVGLQTLLKTRRTPRRTRLAFRTFSGELLLSTLLAPLVMLHHSAAVLSVMMGRDCGWKQPDGPRRNLPQGFAEALTGLTLIALVFHLNPAAAIWLLPVAGPMIAAPLLIRWLNGISPQALPA